VSATPLPPTGPEPLVLTYGMARSPDGQGWVLLQCAEPGRVCTHWLPVELVDEVRAKLATKAAEVRGGGLIVPQVRVVPPGNGGGPSG
jgi:hypothetical protein